MGIECHSVMFDEGSLFCVKRNFLLEGKKIPLALSYSCSFTLPFRITDFHKMVSFPGSHNLPCCGLDTLCDISRFTRVLGNCQASKYYLHHSLSIHSIHDMTIMAAIGVQVHMY